MEWLVPLKSFSLLGFSFLSLLDAGNPWTFIPGSLLSLLHRYPWTFQVQQASLSVSEGCHNRVPWTKSLKMTETYCLTVVKVRSLKSRCQQGCAPSATPGRPVLASPSLQQWPAGSGAPGLVAASAPSASTFTWPSPWGLPASSLCVCLCPHFPLL